jgi:predicted methyltransferase MtxX (methanogen marker protein 4)
LFPNMQFERGATRDACSICFGVNDGAQHVLGGVLQRFGGGGTVGAAFDVEGAVVAALVSEAIDAVVRGSACGWRTTAKLWWTTRAKASARRDASWPGRLAHSAPLYRCSLVD